MAISLPILHEIEVRQYAMYRGEGETGLRHKFLSGVNLIVGTNGLGKTTLLNIILRCLIGPWNPPNKNSVVTSSRQGESVWRERKTFFSKRVADRAGEASATLRFQLADRHFEITRSLSNLRILSMAIDGELVVLEPRSDKLETDHAERVYRDKFSEAMGASSYVAAIQILNQLMFVDEHRRALLWDTQSQTAILRDMLVPVATVRQLRDTESRYLSADSQERNLRWQVNQLNLQLGNMRAAREAAGSVSDQLAILVRQIDADNDRRADIEADLEGAEQDVKTLRLAFERSKLLEADARVEVENARLKVASRLFAHLDDTARYIVSRLFDGVICKACGADAQNRIAHQESLLAKGYCLVCEATPGEQKAENGTAKVADKAELIERDLSQKRELLQTLTTQTQAASLSLTSAEKRLRELSDDMEFVTRSLASARKDAKALQSRIPPSDQALSAQEQEHSVLQTRMHAAAQDRREAADSLRELLVTVRDAAKSRQQEIIEGFTKYADQFLAEDARLVYAPRQEKLGQSGDKFELARYRLDMSSAAYTGLVARDSADDVSESQREFIDLAYRMALVDTCVDGPACLIIETPEASLDGVFMMQAGSMLQSYAARPDRQIIVTSNLSETGLIRSLVEDVDDVTERVVNLFEIAAPTRAVEKFKKEYADLLRQCLPTLKQNAQ